jgi:ribosomal protein S8
MGRLQRVHHLCLKLKHAYLSRTPRVSAPDIPSYRGILNILWKEGFVYDVMPGDERGPFVELISERKANNSDFLLRHQKLRLDVLKDVRAKVLHFHSLLNTPVESFVANNDKRFQQLVKNLEQQQQNKVSVNDRFSDYALLKDLVAVPPASSVRVPPEDFTKWQVQDLMEVTEPSKKRLWVNLRYDRQLEPALTDMFLVSKPSRKVFVTKEDIENVLKGKKFGLWKGSGGLGGVTIIKTEKDGYMTAQEALRKGLGGEVLCVAK